MAAPQFDNSYARLPAGFHAAAEPDAPPSPTLLRLNGPLAEHLGLDRSWLSSPAGLDMLSGRGLPDGAEPIAMAYAGHQFGSWVPQLGDGRALLIGEVIGSDGVRYDVQLKGSGPTHFSRRGDGKSALGPVLREYIVSEAMAALDVPTTRALAAVATGERVLRQRGPEPGGVFTRVAKSHVRVGTFQFFHGRRDSDAVRALADYVIERHYPALGDEQNRYAGLVAAVAERQAELIASWMALGFIHGVMNTDNMQIAGETIDYGPCAFMDVFHPNKKFSSIDHGHRYAWGNQPNIAAWNLTRLAETLAPIANPDEDDPKKTEAWITAALADFAPRFTEAFRRRMLAKLGLDASVDTTTEMLPTTFTALTEGKVDFTLFFRRLTALAAGDDEDPLRQLFADRRIADSWLARWRQQPEAADRVATMQRANPIFIPRNHRIEAAIDAAYAGDLLPFHRLVEVLGRPREEQPDQAELEQAPAQDEVVHQTFCGT